MNSPARFNTFGAARRSGLTRVQSWLRHALFPASRGSALPFAGLPPGVGELPPGGATLLMCADAPSRERVLAAMLQELDAGRTDLGITWLCSGARAPLFMEEELRAIVADELLHVLTWHEDAIEHVRELGAAHLLRELHSGGMRAGDLLIVDLLDPWLAELPDGAALEAGVAEAVEVLAQWSLAHQGPILALAPTHRRGEALLPLVARCKVPRLATLEVAGSVARLDVMRWGAAQRPGPRQRGARHRLDAGGAGRWAVHESAEFELEAVLLARDARAVHAMNSALHDAGERPAGWHGYASLEALLSAAERSVASTVVLAFDHPDSLPILANVICRLRHRHPHLLRIVVRETRAAMRHNGELALLRMGANAILRRDLGFATLEQAVEELAGETYARKPVVNPERLLQRLAPDALQGYLPPLDFCCAVERMLERTADTPLEHSLVFLPLLPQMSPADALHACAPRRDGDLVSADEQGLVLFLFGCPADDAVAALESIFLVPCSEVARNVQIDPEIHSQRLTLNALRRRHPAAGPDASAGAAYDARRRAATVQATVLATRELPAAQGVSAHALPLRPASA